MKKTLEDISAKYKSYFSDLYQQYDIGSPIQIDTIANLKKYIKQIASLYGVSVIYSRNMIKGTYGASSHNKRLIYLTSLERYFGTDRNKFIIKNYVYIFCHELGHQLQNIMLNGRPQFKSDDEIMLYEKNANKLAFTVYKSYFSHITYIDKTYFLKAKIDKGIIKGFYGGI